MRRAEGAEPAAGPRGVLSRGAIVCLGGALILLCVVLYYWPEISNWVVLERWSEEGPRDTVMGCCAALAHSDEAGLEAVLGTRPDLELTWEGDTITAVKLGGGPAPPVAVWPLRSPGAGVQRVEYDLGGGSVTVRVRASEGPEVLFGLRRHRGEWRIERIMGPPLPPADPKTESGSAERKAPDP